MSLESPSTYAEWYWKHSVDARIKADEDAGELFKQYIPNIFGDPEMRSRIPFDFLNKWEAMIESPVPGLGTVGMRFVSEMADSILGETMTHALKDFNYYVASKFADNRITFDMANTLYFRNKIGDDFYQSRIGANGWKLDEAAIAYEASKPYPTISDFMLWGRYHSNGSNSRELVWKKLDISEDEYDVWEWLSLQRLTTDQVHTAYRRGIINETQYQAKINQLGWQVADHDVIEQLGYTFPNAMLLVQGNLFAEMETEEIIADIVKADIHPDYAQRYLDAILTKPATGDLISYQLRIDPDLSDLDDQLRKIGIHPEYNELYKELAHPIPPLTDIITMAVKEAFTPDIAERFGQYEDFPPEFESWAAKKGLTPEWSKRYWAAHWSLPSSQQGFEMLHRGVIDKADLSRLLRALDVMPFWREKLTQIAYNPLTRVDVRRMFKEGVLDEEQVYAAYLDHGYSETNAERMTEFTVKQTISSQAKFTTSDILNAYTDRMIDRSDASSLLMDLGVRSQDVGNILNYQDYKRQWDFTQEKIKGIRNLYRKGVYNENEARAKLLGLNLPSDQVDLLFEQWWFEKEGDLAPTWTKAETLRFFIDGKITDDRARVELKRMGYDDEHINLYMETV